MSSKKYSFSRKFKQPNDKVWDFLTDAEKLARWLLPNDFSLSGTGKFCMWTTPDDAWNGVLHGQIDEVEIGRALSYELQTDISNERSYVQWGIDTDSRSTTLHMQHEGSSQLIETIYMAINQTQVSGHYRKNALGMAEAALSVVNSEQNEFLELLKLEILSDPTDVEGKVEQIAQRYPQYLEHIVCFAIDAYPECTVSLMNRLKLCAGKNYPKLLGISLFLLMFKGGLYDAKAEVSNIDNTPVFPEAEIQVLEGNVGGFAIPETMQTSLEQQCQTEILKGNLRIAAGLALGVFVLASSDAAFAAEFKQEAGVIVEGGELDLLLRDEISLSYKGEVDGVFSPPKLPKWLLQKENQVHSFDDVKDFLPMKIEPRFLLFDRLKKIALKQVEGSSVPELEEVGIEGERVELLEEEVTSQVSLEGIEDEIWTEEVTSQVSLEGVEDEIWTEEVGWYYYVDENFSEDMNDSLLFVCEAEDDFRGEENFFCDGEIDFSSDFIPFTELNDIGDVSQGLSHNSFREDIWGHIEFIEEDYGVSIDFVVFDEEGGEFIFLTGDIDLHRNRIEEYGLVVFEVDYEYGNLNLVSEKGIDEGSYVSSSNQISQEADVYFQL